MSALGAYNLLLIAAMAIALACWLVPKVLRAATRVVVDEAQRRQRAAEVEQVEHDA